MDKQALEYCKNRYRKTKGFELNLENPKYFTEKIQWKKFFDHNPAYTITSDKLAIYSYLGAINSPVMPPMLLASTSLPEIPRGLPDKWIAKANHGSGWNFTHEEKTPRLKMKSWLNQKYAPLAGEWAYKDIEPVIIFQEYLENPVEYKFFVFRGEVGMIQHLTYGIKPTIANYDKDWNYLDVFWVYEKGTPTLKPDKFDEMTEAAKYLGIFDFARIDFMVAGGKVYLSEITHYPTSGFQNIKPLEFDLLLGEKYEIKRTI